MRRAGLRHSPHLLAAGRALFEKTHNQHTWGHPGKKESGGIRIGHQTDNTQCTMMIMVKTISCPSLRLPSLRMYRILKRLLVRLQLTRDDRLYGLAVRSAG